MGFRVLSDRLKVRQENLRRGRRRTKQLMIQYRQGKITLSKLSQSWQSWFAHLEKGDTWRLRQKIFCSLILLRD